jgi:DNA-binding GntR family transcriptional regulator
MRASQVSMKVLSVAAPIRQQVAASFRGAILSGRFQPGERLTEKDLCALTGASRTSVREALRQLEAEGLVDMVPNKGPIVALVDPRQARSIYQVRAALESLAGALFAVNASKAQILQLEAAVSELAGTYRKGVIEEILQKKDAFYEILLVGGGNEIIPALLRTMQARISLLRRVSLSQSARLSLSIKEIRLILKTVKARDAAAAAEACRLHVERAADAALGPINGKPAGR